LLSLSSSSSSSSILDSKKYQPEAQSICDTVLMERCCLLYHDSSLMHDNTAKSAGFFFLVKLYWLSCQSVLDTKLNNILWYQIIMGLLILEKAWFWYIHIIVSVC
jgi:hypothetical protein